MNIYLYPSNTETKLKNAYIGEYGWKPDSTRTILYLPLENNATDQSWNNVSTSYSSWVSFTTQWWISCVNVSYSSVGIALSPTNIVNTSQTKKTISVLLYFPSLYTSYQKTIYYAMKDTSPFCSSSEIRINGYDYDIVCVIDANPYINAIRYQPPQWQWFHFVQTTESWTNWNKMYINWELVAQDTGPNTPRWWVSWSWTNNILNVLGNGSSNRWLDWYAREMIWENVVWSADEVLEYYNNIKEKLWF